MSFLTALPCGAHTGFRSAVPVLPSAAADCVAAAQPPWSEKEDNNILRLLQQCYCSQVTDLQVITGLAVLHKSNPPPHLHKTWLGSSDLTAQFLHRGTARMLPDYNPKTPQIQVEVIAKIATETKDNSSLGEVFAATLGLWECGAEKQGWLPRALHSHFLSNPVDFESENNPVFCSRRTNPSKARVSQQTTPQEALLLISFGFPYFLYNSTCLTHLRFFMIDEAFCHCSRTVAIWGWSTLMKGFLFCILLFWKRIYLHAVPNIQLPVPVTHLSTLIFLPIPFPPLFLLQGLP